MTYSINRYYFLHIETNYPDTRLNPQLIALTNIYVFQRNVCLMKPWIILTGIYLVLYIFNILRALISLAIIDVICSILGWVLGAYFFLVVWSFKNEVEDEVGAGGHQGEVHYKREGKV